MPLSDAEKIAKEIMSQVWEFPVYSGKAEELISAALREYGQDCADRASDAKFEAVIQAARTAALEEAAKIAENYVWEDGVIGACPGIVKAIRALKNK